MLASCFHKASSFSLRRMLFAATALQVPVHDKDTMNPCVPVHIRLYFMAAVRFRGFRPTKRESEYSDKWPKLPRLPT